MQMYNKLHINQTKYIIYFVICFNPLFIVHLQSESRQSISYPTLNTHYFHHNNLLY